METLLEVENLSAGYADWLVLEGVSFEAAEQRITGIIGPNGCGKSTLLKSVVGLVPPWSGRVRFRGEDITHQPPFETLTRGLAYIPQGTQVFPDMTVEENLLVAAHTVKDPGTAQERFATIYENHFPLLKERRRQIAGTLSGGQQSMLSFAMALVLEPDCVMLDEPSLGLAPQMLHGVFETIVQLNEQGLTFVIIEQNVRALLEVVDHITILDNGTTRYSGTPQHLQDEGDLMNLYVGLASTE